LLLVALLASYIPAGRAMRVDPSIQIHAPTAKALASNRARRE
jgi:hypothetical protein